MAEAGYMDLNFELYFEPEGGINTPEEFTSELFTWSHRENNDLIILEESMEPKIKLNDEEYICRLGTPNVAAENNAVWKGMGFKGVNQSVGKFLGYKWVYLYRV